MVLFGEDISKEPIVLNIDGVDKQVTLLEATKRCFRTLIHKMNNPVRLLTPFFDAAPINAQERAHHRDAYSVREICKRIVRDRKAGKSKSKVVAGQDLLDILLEDKEFFADDEESMVSQLLDFFFAGTNTTSQTTQMLILQVLRNKDIGSKMHADFKKHVLDPYLEEDATEEEKSGKKEIDLVKAMTFERLFNLEYFKMLMEETLRFNPVATIASRGTVSQDTNLGDLKFKKNDVYQVYIWGLHYNPEQWREPEKFVPERFDTSNDYWSLTPSGEKRSPMSYLPFYGGRRICFGKMFAEAALRVNALTLTHTFDFEFEDPKYLTEDLPPHNALMSGYNHIWLKARLKKH